MSEQDDFFSGVLDSKANAGGGGTKFRPGIYPAVRIDALRVKSGYHGLRFIVECTVVAEATERTEGVEPTAVGSAGSWSPRIDGQHADLGLGEVMEFVGLLNGLTIEEVNADKPKIKELMGKAISVDQPHTGQLLATEAWKHVTGSNFTMIKHKWHPAEGVVETAAPEAPAAPAAPAAPEAEPEGGPWYPIANDPRGTFYNEAGAFSSH